MNEISYQSLFEYIEACERARLYNRVDLAMLQAEVLNRAFEDVQLSELFVQHSPDDWSSTVCLIRNDQIIFA